MTQYPPKTLSCSEYSKEVKVVLQNTRVQTHGPSAGGGYFHNTTFRTQQPKHIFFLYFIINQPNLCPSYKCCVKNSCLSWEPCCTIVHYSSLGWQPCCTIVYYSSLSWQQPGLAAVFHILQYSATRTLKLIIRRDSDLQKYIKFSLNGVIDYSILEFVFYKIFFTIRTTDTYH